MRKRRCLGHTDTPVFCNEFASPLKRNLIAMAFSHWVAVSTNFPRMKLVQFLQDWVDPKLAPNPSISSGIQFKMLTKFVGNKASNYCGGSSRPRPLACSPNGCIKTTMTHSQALCESQDRCLVSLPNTKGLG